MVGSQAQARPALAWLRCLALLLGLPPATAEAGAWIAPEGGQEITTTAFGERGGLSFFESSTYWEVPLSREASVVASPWVEQNYDTPEGWRGEAVVALKHVVGRADRVLFAVQAGAAWESHPVNGCGEGGAEVRLLAGRQVGSQSFVNLEAAHRAFEGGCGGRRIDLTAGLRPADDWLLMGQVFLEDEASGSSSKAQLTLAHFGAEGRGLQVGVRARLDGDDPEPALIIGLWGRPGDD